MNELYGLLKIYGKKYLSFTVKIIGRLIFAGRNTIYLHLIIFLHQHNFGFQ